MKSSLVLIHVLFNSVCSILAYSDWLFQDDEGTLNTYRITSLLAVGPIMWVGTGDGTLYMYQVHEMASRKSRGKLPPSPLVTSPKFGSSPRTISPRHSRNSRSSRKTESSSGSGKSKESLVDTKLSGTCIHVLCRSLKKREICGNHN